jgi:hypothetical protein
MSWNSTDIRSRPATKAYRDNYEGIRWDKQRKLIAVERTKTLTRETKFIYDDETLPVWVNAHEPTEGTNPLLKAQQKKYGKPDPKSFKSKPQPL